MSSGHRFKNQASLLARAAVTAMQADQGFTKASSEVQMNLPPNDPFQGSTRTQRRLLKKALKKRGVK